MTSNTLTPITSNFSGQGEHADAVKFAHALRPPPAGLYTLQHFCPSVTPHSSCLDVLLFRGVLLVAYAAADEIVIARAADLQAVKRLRTSAPPSVKFSPNVTALAFRQRDAAIVAAFHTTIVVFEGWSTAAKERGIAYDSAFTETVLDVGQLGATAPIVSLSWDSHGLNLCAVADCVFVWCVDPDHLPVRYTVSVNIQRESMPTLPLALGVISPDASLIAVSGLYARSAYVWDLRKKPYAPHAVTEIAHGRSGISAIDWKRRGGGNQALMTSDRDGTIRLWVRASSLHNTSGHAPDARATGTDSWMEEIARSPHVERTPRAGATFLAWGGGGGVADDEGDAMATNVAHPFLVDRTAPKPSRCYHWIIRVAGGDARAWRVRGLDDRPRAEFTRLEPGSGEPLLGVEDDCDEELPKEFPLKDVSVAAVKAVAPIPLTTSSQYKVGLVKSYAISNGERRLRSPEPPEPPNIVALFILAVRNGLPFLSRYDICPTSNMPAVCRARIGLGHSSPVVEIVIGQQSSSSMLGSGGWLASRGRSGDVLLWRTNVSTGAWESMRIVAVLPGPHTAVAVAPSRTSSPNRWEVSVFTCDAAMGSLRLFSFINFVSRHDNSAGQDLQFAKQVAVCHARGRSSADTVTQLRVVSLNVADCDQSMSSSQAVFGVRRNGRLSVWHMSRSRRDSISLEPSVIRFVGKRHESVLCVTSDVLTSIGREIFVAGGRDGSVLIYIAGSSESDIDLEGDAIGDSEEEENEEGVVWLKELCHLQSEAHRFDAVVKVEAMTGASRILAVHASGASVVWFRDSSGSATWEVELTVPGDSSDGVDSSDKKLASSNKMPASSVLNGCETSSTIGYDRDGHFSVVALRGNGLFDRYRRILGHPWECVHRREAPQDSLPRERHCIVHIGKGVVVCSNGRGLSVLGSSRSDSHPLSFMSDAAGYNPSKALVAQLLTGGRAWQVSAALMELHTFVGKMMTRKASETSYGAGRGLIPPPPSLKVLLSQQGDVSKDVDSTTVKSIIQQEPENIFQLGSGKNLFMQLMAKSEVNVSDNDKVDDLGDANSASSSPRDLSRLANRLRVVSLAGMTRNEQSVLAVIARSCASLDQTLGSLDAPGARFALLATSHREITRTLSLPLSIVASAVHSSSRDALMDHFLAAPSPGAISQGSGTASKMWESARVLGAGWWVITVSECRKLAERIARADFAAHRNADDAALWYIALGRRTALAALYRAQRNLKMSQFLMRNFNANENRVAAGKNAYVLVSKHRLELAVAFFMLSGDVAGALSLVRSRIKDDQLAMFLSRVIGDEEQISMTLRHIIKRSDEEQDDHRRALALWLNGEHDASLTAASEARSRAAVEKSEETENVLSGCLPDVVHSLAHVLAIANCPPVRGTDRAREIITLCRRKAVQALLGDGSPVAALVVAFEIIGSEGGNQNGQKAEARTYSRRHVETTLGSALLAAVDTLKGRAVCLSGAVRSGAVQESLQELILRDITDLERSPLGLERTITAVECAALELVKEDEIDSAMAAIYAGLKILQTDSSRLGTTLMKKIQAAQRNCLRMAVSKALLYVQGALSLLHHPTVSGRRLAELLAKYKLAVCHTEMAASSRGGLYHRLVLEFKGSVLALGFSYMFLKGDWPGVLQVLRSCDASWQPQEHAVEDVPKREKDDSHSTTSCSTLTPDAVSIEALRHVASNPAILRISRSLGHVRRCRKTPSMAIVGMSNGSAAAVMEDSFGSPTLAVSADDPYAVIRMHPALSCTLASAAAAYLAAHLAAKASAFAKFVSMDGSQQHRSSELFWQTDSGQGYDQSFRLIKASEALEQLAEDAIAQWIPLQKFGVEADSESMGHQDEAAGAFVDLWSTLGCLPEYAPSLSEAATVAAAEMAAAASRAAIQAAEEKDGGRRRRRRREREGEIVTSAAKEGLKLFDTTSADSLYGAYPVRFSASAQGPWSGRGRHATLYSEDRSLFRTLCVGSTDPPAVVVATPKGIQEIVPSSYTTMPAGFRSHYASKRRSNSPDGVDERLKALAMDRDEGIDEDGEDEEDSFLNSYDGFGEGPYVALDMSRSDSAGRSLQRISDGRNRKAVWRRQVHATTLASHPLRRRFASGGMDGVVRLWDFADPISLASFREDHFGRISEVCFSAYGNTMMAVYSSGNVTIWDDPDIYSGHPRKRGNAQSSRAKTIRAFDNRSASGATFLDERHTIAVVGDPTAPPSVGHSLRIFDTREAHSSFHASWSAAVNHQFEARCVALLDDRMRVVTGGLDGSLSIVDLRTKACIAELPAHTDEVTCLALEQPRGRALVSGSANGEIRLWDARTLLLLDTVAEAHTPTRHYWSGNGIGGLVGSYGTQGLALTDRSLISCGGDGAVKIWGPGWTDFDLNVV